MQIHELIRARELRKLEEKLLIAKVNEMADQLEEAIKISRRITGVKRRKYASETDNRKSKEVSKC